MSQGTKRHKMSKCPRVFSLNFPNGFEKTAEICFVPLSDFRALEKKYLQLFARKQREKNDRNK
jgi:hypothetical protein